MKEIVSDEKLVAYCGLYCGACRAYLNEKCLGCQKNEKATWCKIRTCCMENKFSSCANCKEYSDPNQCKKYNNLIAKIIGFIVAGFIDKYGQRSIRPVYKVMPL